MPMRAAFSRGHGPASVAKVRDEEDEGDEDRDREDGDREDRDREDGDRVDGDREVDRNR